MPEEKTQHGDAKGRNQGMIALSAPRNAFSSFDYQSSGGSAFCGEPHPGHRKTVESIAVAHAQVKRPVRRQKTTLPASSSGYQSQIDDTDQSGNGDRGNPVFYKILDHLLNLNVALLTIING